MPTEVNRPAFPKRALIAGALCFVLALALDRWGWDHLRRDGIYDRDWGRLLRIMGFWPTWVAGAVALVLHDRGVSPPPAGGMWRRGLLLAVTTGIAGFVAEGLKLVFRRERPSSADGEYVFRAFTDQTWSTKGLGLPSSHAIVAFAGAATLSLLFPRTWPVWWLLAAGAAYTRVAAGAHFLSDVVMAAFAGWLLSFLAWRYSQGGTVSQGGREGTEGSGGS